MRNTQNSRTIQNITRYIRTACRDGVLKESMMAIAGRTGYSNATVHRTLQTLKDRGMIRTVTPASPKEPTIIYYLGPEQTESEELLQRATQAMNELNRAADEMQGVMNDICAYVSSLPQQSQTYVH